MLIPLNLHLSLRFRTAHFSFHLEDVMIMLVFAIGQKNSINAELFLENKI
jgi:hypothetical protein